MAYVLTSETMPQIAGRYIRSREGGRAVYVRQGGAFPAFMYRWDEGHDEHRGWWVGPEVGSEQVWAYNPKTLHLPPRVGWMLSPGDDTGLVQDESTCVRSSERNEFKSGAREPYNFKTDLATSLNLLL